MSRSLMFEFCDDFYGTSNALFIVYGARPDEDADGLAELPFS